MKSTGSTKASRTPFCLTSKAVLSRLSVQPPKIRLFEVNNALLSRAAVYVLKSLNDDHLKTLLERALEKELDGLSISSEAQTMLVMSADGDARRLLNRLRNRRPGRHRRDRTGKSVSLC